MTGTDIRGDLVQAAPQTLHPLLGRIVELETFRTQQEDVELGVAERRLVVDQALLLIEQNYVHLPHKVAMHAINPVQRLRLLRARLAAAAAAAGGGTGAGTGTGGTQSETLPPAATFHAEMSEIFHSMRDLHTNYLLPPPFAGQVAFLPFLVEEFHTDDGPRYLVTKVMQGAPTDAGFGRGVLVTAWNGVPIQRAVEVAAARYAGSNASARHARGVESLTVRPLRMHRYPDEDWVVVGFERPDGTAGQFRQPWLVAPNLPPAVPEGAAGAGDVDRDRTLIGLDLEQDEANRARKLLFAPGIAVSELDADADAPPAAPDEVPTVLPGVFRARRVGVGGVEYGHLRIFTFSVQDPAGFVAEFVRLVQALPATGLILDVRGNGGGHIWAAELTLQTLTPVTITPEPTQFINTPLNAELCRQHAQGQGGIDLGVWLPSIELSVETGAPHSNAYPITPPDLANAIGQKYFGPVVLVTDARCYSATDIFAAGFQDHGIGTVLGVDANTGAGGANVWTHGLLSQLVQDRDGVRSPFQPLPAGVDMRVSIRRTLRVGRSAGTPVEDLGVRPDVRHRLTRADVAGANEDLMAEAARLLAGRPVRRLDVATQARGSDVTELTLTTTGLDRVDVYLDGRPVLTRDVSDDAPTVVELTAAMTGVPAGTGGGPGGGRLRFLGFASGDLVANRQETLGAPGSGGTPAPGPARIPAPAQESSPASSPMALPQPR